MVYTHVLNRGGRGVVSPVDRLVGAGSFPAGLGRDSLQPISAKRGRDGFPETGVFSATSITSRSADLRSG